MSETNYVSDPSGVFTFSNNASSISQRKISKTLTNDQIKALPSTPVELIPASGAGTLIIPTYGLYMTTFPTPYANVSTDFADIYISIDGIHLDSLADILNANFTTPVTTDLSLFLNVSGTNPGSTWQAIPYQNVRASLLAYFNTSSPPPGINKPAKLTSFNGLGNFTGGGAGNSLKIILFYAVITP